MDLVNRGFVKGVVSPLVSGVTGRVGKLRGYGNSIVAPLAAEFIKVVMEWKS